MATRFAGADFQCKVVPALACRFVLEEIAVEYIDIYDSEKRLTGVRLPRKDYFLKENQYAVIVVGLIERSDRRFLATRRSEDKKWAAGWWEIPGGGVRAGEASAQAIVREIKEETGLDVTDARGGLMYTYSRENLKKGDNYFVDIYHFHMDFDEGDVRVNSSEVTAFKLMTWDEMTALNQEHLFLHYDRLREGLEQESLYGLNCGRITRFAD